MKPLDREILRLAIPSILANITVPLVGMVDLAIAGPLHDGGLPAAFIGAVSVGGKIWTARMARPDGKAKKGELVRAVRIEGVKLIVEQVREKQEVKA